MSSGSRAKDVSEARRAAAEQATISPPTSEVVVKLRSPPADLRGRRPAVRDVMRVSSIAVESHGSSLLSRLVENGVVAEVSPIFLESTLFAALEEAIGKVPFELPSDLPFGARTMALREAKGVRGLDRPFPAAKTRQSQRARGLTSLKLKAGESAQRLAEHLQQQENVEYAYVPKPRYPMLARPAGGAGKTKAEARARRVDPLSARQWSHAAVRIHEAREREGFDDAQDVRVAIVDSGIDKKHPDLVDSIERYENLLPTESDRDFRGHGTHVAGIIAAGINNAVGIAGLCRARLVVLKALPKRGGEWNATAYYRALGRTIDLDCRVLNLSLGADSEDPGERDVILDLIDAGVVVVAAMGNEFEEGNPINYPAAYKGVIAVGASDEADRRAVFSCTGSHIALVAPGERILSTVPRYESEFAETTMYDSWPGTSMATPHVAAAAALLLAKEPGLTPGQVRTRLCRKADRVAAQKKRPDRDHGWGRLNIAEALG